MAYELLRIFYALWLAGGSAFILNALSNIVFARKIQRNDIKIILTLPFFIAVWPLALCSPNGRKILLTKFNKL
jgi:hypothetical protein